LTDLKLSYSLTSHSQEIDFLFSDENDFFRKGEAKLFAKNNDKFIGFWHPDYVHKGEPYICFGYWCFENQNDFSENMESLQKWTAEKNIGQILGPIDFSTLHNYRLPLAQFEQNFMGEPSGNMSQTKALKNFKFKSVQRYSSYYINDPSSIYSWGKKRSQKILKQGAVLKSLSFDELDFSKRRLEVYSLIDRVFQNNLGYLKPNHHELNFLYHENKLKHLSKFPFFFVEDDMEKLVGLFVSFIGPNVFESGAGNCLYFKTIGAEPSKNLHNPVFFFLIHEIYRTYEQMNMNLPICFSLMREGNVAEKVAKMFSNQSRSYALFRLGL